MFVDLGFKKEELLQNSRRRGRDFHEKFRKFIESIPDLKSRPKREVIIRFLAYNSEHNLLVPNYLEVDSIFNVSIST